MSDTPFDHPDTDPFASKEEEEGPVYLFTDAKGLAIEIHIPKGTQLTPPFAIFEGKRSTDPIIMPPESGKIILPS